MAGLRLACLSSGRTKCWRGRPAVAIRRNFAVDVVDHQPEPRAKAVNVAVSGSHDNPFRTRRTEWNALNQRSRAVQLDASPYHQIKRIFSGRGLFDSPFQPLLALFLGLRFTLRPQHTLPESALKSGPASRIRTAPYSDCPIPRYVRGSSKPVLPLVDRAQEPCGVRSCWSEACSGWSSV